MNPEYIHWVMTSFGLSYEEAVDVDELMTEFKGSGSPLNIPITVWGLIARTGAYMDSIDENYDFMVLVEFSIFEYVREGNYKTLDLFRKWCEIHDGICDCGLNMLEAFEQSQEEYKRNKAATLDILQNLFDQDKDEDQNWRYN